MNRRMGRSGFAASTQVAYRRHWQKFQRWCAAHERSSIPATAADLLEYLGAMHAEGKSVATIDLAVAAISANHRDAGAVSPRWSTAVKDFVGALRQTRIVQKKTPLLWDGIKRVVDALPPDEIGVRDRAVLLLGWFAALRREEIAGLRRGDISIDSLRVAVRVARSKTDQAGVGATVVVPRRERPPCAVTTMEEWLSIRGDYPGPLFLGYGGDRKYHGSLQHISGQMVSRIIKGAVTSVGLDPRDFGVNSLRRGFATELYQRGVPDEHVMDHARWRAHASFEQYIDTATERPGGLFDDLD